MRQFVLGLSLLASSCALVGCGQDTKSDTATSGNGSSTVAPKAQPAPAASDMTHTLNMDAPYYGSMPSSTTAPAGTFKKGSKVVVMMPMGGYSQVVSDAGIKAYVKTAALDPIGK